MTTVLWVCIESLQANDLGEIYVYLQLFAKYFTLTLVSNSIEVFQEYLIFTDSGGYIVTPVAGDKLLQLRTSH